jgi:hypothetical protein
MKNGYISGRPVVFAILFMMVALAGLAGTSQAQYIWMDSNGDGVFTAADRMKPNGTPTTVDVWLNTDHNRDGSLATCDTADGNLDTWNSYAVHINAINGTATFTNFTNEQASFTIGCSATGGIYFQTDGSAEMTACAATGAQTPNGGVNQKLFTMTVTGVSGTPALEFVPQNNLDAASFTSFGTPCMGNDTDNTYKLGPLPGGAGPGDFLDADGLPAAAGTPVTETTWGKIKSLYKPQ